MIIFRCKLLFLSACVLFFGCTEEVVEEDYVPIQREEYTPKVVREGEGLILGEFLKSHQDNPNKFRLDNENKEFEVFGKIERVPEYREVIVEVSGFWLPIKLHELSEQEQYDRTLSSAANQAFVDSLSVFVDDLTLEESAALSPDDEIRTRCEKVRVMGSGITFDGCKVIKKK